MIHRQKLFTFESKVTAMVIAIILASTAFTADLIAMISGTILREQAVRSCQERLHTISRRFDITLNRIQSQASLLTFYKATTHRQTSSQETSTPYEAFLRDAAFSSYLAEYLATQPAVALSPTMTETTSLFPRTPMGPAVEPAFWYLRRCGNLF